MDLEYEIGRDITDHGVTKVKERLEELEIKVTIVKEELFKRRLLITTDLPMTNNEVLALGAYIGTITTIHSLTL